MRLFLRNAILVLLLFPALPRSTGAEHLLWQTNSQGSDLHVFDIETRTLVKRLEVGPHPHGVAAPEDARFVLVTLEANGRPAGQLIWIDPVKLEVTHRLEVGPEPHALAVTSDGHWAYVPCRDGHYWVIDVPGRKVVTRINTGGRPHNTSASPDGRFMYLSPMGEPRRVTIVDVPGGHRVIGEIPFRDSVRPAALSSDNRFLFQHVDGVNGFQAADVRRRKVLATVEHSHELGWFLLRPARLGWLGPDGLQRCHGLAIRPNQREIWSACGAGINVHRMVPPGFPELVRIPMIDNVYWLTFSPDSRYAFAAVRDRKQVAMIDANTKKVLAHLDVGQSPKRNLVIARKDRR